MDLNPNHTGDIRLTCHIKLGAPARSMVKQRPGETIGNFANNSSGTNTLLFQYRSYAFLQESIKHIYFLPPCLTSCQDLISFACCSMQ